MTRDFFEPAVERHARKVDTFASYLLGDTGEAEALDRQMVADRVGEAAAELQRTGWRQLIRVENAEERIFIYSVDGPDGTIAGLTALVSDVGKEAVVANLAGSIDPVLLGNILGRLGEMDFDQFISTVSDDD